MSSDSENNETLKSPNIMQIAEAATSNLLPTKKSQKIAYQKFIVDIKNIQSCVLILLTVIVGQGKCGVAVIRVSGSNAKNALKLVTKLSQLPKPRTAVLKSIIHPKTQEILDKGLLLWFPGPRSFTGEDSFELQVHGGFAVINAVLNALGSVPKLRLAEPGEFTRRSFHNSKLDLTEVEGLADLLQAETEAQRKQAFLQTQGCLSKLYKSWKTTLTRCVAYIDAHVDFEESDTLEYELIQSITKQIQDLSNEIEKHLSDGRKGEILRNGVKTVILGEPNAGKSSLLNLLSQRPAAIVTPIEGTTRDILEVTLNIDGYPLVLADTAGLRLNTHDIVEEEGINRALKCYEKSDLVLLVIDSQKFIEWKRNNPHKNFSEYVKDYVGKLNLNHLLNYDGEHVSNIFNKNCIIVLNKSDLGDIEICKIIEDNVVRISCKTEEGVTNLVKTISQKLKILCGEPSQDHPSMNQLRHRQHLTDCLNYLHLFLKEVSNDTDVEVSLDLVLMAEYIRKALRHLGKLVGIVTTEQILDVIFKDFCIGK